MIEDAAMDAVDERVGPKIPVELREETVTVPRAALEAGAACCKRDAAELAALSPGPADEMGSIHVLIRAPLLERRRLRTNVEAEPSWWVPDRDRFDERSGRELAGADRADAGAADPRAQGIGDAEPEDEFARRRQFRDADDVRPNRA